MSGPETTGTEVAPTRNDRQAGILPPDRLNVLTASIIGTGAIGRQVALQLAAAGQRRIRLFDHDTVEIPNLGPQGFMEEDVGKSKVEAVAALMNQMNYDLDVETIQRRIGAEDEVGEILFVCVDSIATRREIYENYKDRVQLFIDARMAAETIRIIAACDPESFNYYPETLFEGNEAFQGACTAKSTIFCSNIAAGLMVGQYSKWLRDFPLDRDYLVNLLSLEIIHQ